MKNRSSIVAAVIQNADILKNAYADAFDSEGSSDKELNTYMDSIQGHIDQFNNAVQTMWMNFINSDVVKFIVDIGTGLVNIIDKVGVLQSLFTAVFSWKTTFSRKNKLDLASLLGIHDTKKGFSVWGKQGLSKKVVNLFKKDNSASITDDLWSIGDEQTVARQLDEITDAASNGQEALTNYVSTLGDGDVALRSYAMSVTNGQYSLAGFNQFIQQHNQGLEQSRLALLGTKAAHLALNAALSMGISFLVSVGISAIQKWINAEKEAAEAARNAVVESQKLTETRSSLEDYKNQIEELRKSIDSGNLTQSEAYDARKKLLTIQEELISKYGIEKDGINLVTGAIQDQIDAIDELSKQDAHQWVIENQKEINDAVKYFEDEDKFGQGKGFVAGLDAAFVNWGVTHDVYQKVAEYINSREHMSQKGSGLEHDIYFEGSAEEVKAETDAFYAWLKTYETDLNNIINGTTGATEKEIKQAKKDLKQVQDYIEDLGKWRKEQFGDSSTYVANEALIKEAQEKTAIAKYSDQYMAILKAQNDFLEAQANGNEAGMQNALEAYHTAINAAKDVATESYMDDFFDGLDGEFATEEFELNLTTNNEELKTEIQSIINDSDLSELYDIDLKDMVLKGLNVEGALAGETGYTQDQVDGLIVLQAQADEARISIETLISVLTNLGLIKGQPIEAIAKSIEATGKAYSMLTTEAEKYKDINETLNELTYDGIEISEDQYDELNKLIGTEKEFADCIDTTDGYIVKDIALTKQLIDKKKEELAAETKLAKHQAQLEYYDLVKELDMVVEGYEGFTEADKAATDSLLEQIRTVKNSINQYQLLEYSLLGVTSAFDNFASAQELDEQNTYGDSYVEMAQTMYDAIYNTGEVGSKAFWAAVEAYVPKEYYINLTPGTEQLAAITDYLNKNVFSTLTLDEGTFSIDYSAVEDFVERAQQVGIFTGTDASAFGLSGDFINSLAEGENGLAKFAEQMGMTETQAYAMLTVMDKFNANGAGLSMLLQLDNSTTGQITLATNQLEQLYEQRKVLIEQRDELAASGEDTTAINVQLESNWQDIAKAESTLAGLEKQAQDTAKAYIEVESAKSSISTTDELNEALNKIPEDLRTKLSVELEGAQTAEDVLQVLTDYQMQLQTPSVMELEIEKDKVQSELAAIENQVEGIQDKVIIGEGGIYQAAEGVTVDENLQTYINLLNEESVIESTLSSVLSTSEQYLSEIAKNTAIMAGEDTESGTTTSSDDGSDGKTSTSSGFGGADGSDGIISPTIQFSSDDVDETIFGSELEENGPYDMPVAVDVPKDALGDDPYDMPVAVDVPKDAMPTAIDIPVELSDAYDSYKKDLEELSQLGFNPSQTTFGNIDTNDRQVLEWNTDNLNKYKEALMSWYDDMSWDDIVNDFSGTLSTVMGSSDEYYGIEVAFSPMLQTENGPVLLDKNTVDEYIWQLIDTAYAQFGEEWTTSDLLNLDAQGLEFYGQIIKGLLADVGNTAAQTGEAMHYTGIDGSIAQSYKIIEDAAQEAGISVDEMITRLEGGKNITITAEADTGSAEKAGQEIGDAAQGSADNVTVGADTDTDNDYSLNNPNNMVPKSVKTNSQLQTDFESLNDVLSQTEEIIGNGTEVTQSYKETLAELLDMEVSDLGKYFEESNGLIVKNADGLKELVKEAKNATKQNAKLARSQAELEYMDLVDQLDDVLNATEDFTSESIDAASALLSQIDSVQRTIDKYQLLEESLLGAANAFTSFQEAQEVDNQNTYGDSYVEMAQTIYDAYTKTGEVGSEAVNAAVAALIDPSVYAGLNKDSDEYHQAIYKAFEKYILPTLTLDDDSLSLEFENVEDFVRDGLGKIFTGTSTTDFDLVEGMSLEEAAEQMGMTETHLYAMLAALKLFTGKDYLSEFVDDSLSGDIVEVTNNIENLNREKLELLKKDNLTEEEQQRITEINQELSQQEQELQKLGETAYSTWQEYTSTDAALTALEQVEDKTTKVSDVFDEDLIASLGLEGDETVQEAYDLLLKKKLALEEPSVITAKYAIENIDSQIETLETALANNDWENVDPVSVGLEVGETPTKEDVEAALTGLKEDKVAIAAAFNIELSEEEKAGVQDQLDAIEEFKINDKTFVVTGDTSATMIKLQQVKTALNLIKDKNVTVTTTYKTSGSPSSSGGGRVNGTAHVNGTAFKGGSWGAPKTETALVGELGEELIVRDGRWFTVGQNGAEFTDVRRGDIIFNHKQTEDLLSKGYVTGRGTAFAEGTAYSSALWKPTGSSSSSSSSSSKKSSSSSKKSSSSDDEEVFDWFEVLLEEINEQLDLMDAKLQNVIGHINQNNIIDKIISTNRKLYDDLLAGAKMYDNYAASLLKKIPEEYREAAQNGNIAIEEFVGDTDKETLEAIQEYREWVQKGADATQQAEEVLTEISTLAKQAIENIASDYENKTSIRDSKIDQYEAYNALLETDLGFESSEIYQAMIDETNANIKTLEKQRDTMQAELNKRVESGEIKKYSQDWYDTVNDIAAVDTEIIELKADTEDYQDTINELHWDKFDFLMDKLTAVSDEAENLIEVLSDKDLVDKDTGEWTDAGITSLGLYAQQMEVAEMQAKKYEEEIKYLNKNWKKLGYTEQEYVEKLDELKDGQYDAIKAYNDTKDAIVDLNKERVEAIKTIIEDEIDAYQKLIDKKKEELDSEKDLFDFQKSIQEKQKNISDIQRKLDALAGDNSASARAQRAKLQAELAEAEQELQDAYYDRSISDRQEALDKELEAFEDAKNDEMEALEDYLEDTNKVVSDSLELVKANTSTVYQELQTLGQEYSLSITESLTSPWKNGEDAIQSFSETFGLAMSSTVKELQELEAEFAQFMADIEHSGKNAADVVDKNAAEYQAAVYQPSKDQNDDDEVSNASESATYPYGKASETTGNIKQGSSGNAVKAIQYALNQLGYGNSGTKNVDGKFGSDTASAVKKFQKAMGVSADGIVGDDTRAKFKLKGYAKGTSGVDKDQWAFLDELGDELVLGARNGRVAYLEKGSGVIPEDMTANLMEWGELNPQSMLDRNRPVVNAPSIINNNIELTLDVGEVVHIDTVTNDTLPDLTKTITRELDKYMKNLNSQIRKYTR